MIAIEIRIKTQKLSQYRWVIRYWNAHALPWNVDPVQLHHIHLAFLPSITCCMCIKHHLDGENWDNQTISKLKLKPSAALFSYDIIVSVKISKQISLLKRQWPKNIRSQMYRAFYHPGGICLVVIAYCCSDTYQIPTTYIVARSVKKSLPFAPARSLAR